MDSSNADDTPFHASMTCPTCAGEVRSGQKFCGKCGERLPSFADVALRSPATPTLPDIVRQQIASHYEPLSPRELRVRLGSALRHAARYVEAAQEYERALLEAGSSPPSHEIRCLLAYAHHSAGARDAAVQSYLEAVTDASELAHDLLPYVQGQLTPESAAFLSAWFETEWEPAVAATRAQPVDRIHVDIFRCRMHLYVRNFAKACAALRSAQAVDPNHFAAVAPELMALSTLPSSLTSSHDGNTLSALAEISVLIGDHQALTLIEQALAAGLTNNLKYPEAPGYALKAAILEQHGELGEAARWYYDAGRRFSWSDEFARALPLLEKSKRLDPTHAPTYWQLLEAQRLLSYTSSPPFVEPDHVAAALESWEAGNRLGAPTADQAWVYNSRALLNEQRARLPGASVHLANWEAVAILEGALLVDDSDVTRWTFLARFHRELGNTACALEAADQALSLDADDIGALEERLLALSNTGAASEALAAIQKRRSLDNASSSWLDVVQAFNLLFTGPLSEVLTLTTAAIASAPTELSYLEMRATCYRLMQQWQLAADDSARIWSQFDSSDANGRATFAWAAYYLEDFGTARGLFHQVADDPIQSALAHRGIGLCGLALGDWEVARAHLTRGIADAREPRELEGLLRDDVPFAMRVADNRPDLAPARDLLRELTPVIEQRLAELRVPRTVEAELQLALNLSGAAPASDNWAWIGTQAALARGQLAAGRWRHAAAIYQSLKATGRFPQADLGLATALQKLTASGMADFADGNVASADAAFLEATRTYRANGVSAGDHLGATLRSLISAPQTYWAVTDHLRQMIADPSVSASDRDDLNAARRELTSYLTTAFGLEEPTSPGEDRPPMVIPILLEIGEHLVSIVDPSQDGGAFIDRRIPEMRTRLAERLGFPVPGTRARSSTTLGGHEYSIQIDECTVSRGEAYPDLRYCAAAATELLALGVAEEAITPVGFGSGTWLPSAQADTAVRGGVAVITAAEFLIAELERAICAHAATLLTTDEVESLLEQWRTADPNTAKPLMLKLEDASDRRRFVRLLRRLAREHVSLTSWPTVVAAVQTAGLEDEEQALSEVRRRMLGAEPQGPVTGVMMVPPEWEEWLDRDPTQPLAVSPLEALIALAHVRTWMRGNNPPTTLVTRHTRLQPIVRRLVEGEFPQLRVVAAPELPESYSAPPVADSVAAPGDGASANA